MSSPSVTDLRTKIIFELRVFANEKGRASGLNPIDHRDYYTTAMRTEALKMALNEGKYDVIFGGARRDEERTRAKERIVSVRNEHHGWDPRQQRPEIWSIFNWRRTPEQSFRVFPLSNWTELDLWSYIVAEGIPLTPLYFAAPRPVIQTGNALIMLDEPERWTWGDKKTIEIRSVRFRTLGCWPVTGAIESTAFTAEDILSELAGQLTSERGGRISDSGSLEQQKREGYF